ncbi:hypothetical protein UFOVP29_302 [uncultured Caudovirales phage]|jgi:hypothetical protein|uniref:Uncharacterized protein n=1 Tax=uncultured Caudovirales phage TaxID=2100421 RepID=A0A6J5KPJ3_9CAUD|nr:hypothetical protein UFOVP29_302 [uncultured Caudovirales phage]
MAKTNDAAWDNIFENVVMAEQPPSKYIIEAFVTTKSGTTYKVSGKDFLDLWHSEQKKGSEESLMVYCKVSLDFTRIKRDVSRWANSLVKQIESEFPKQVD